MGYYQYLVQLDEHFEEEKERLITGCRQLLHMLLRKDNMLISITGGEEEYRALEQEIGSFLERIDAFQAADSKASNAVLSVFGGEQKRVSEAFSTPAEIQYVAIAGKFDNVKEVNNGALQVVRHLLNYDYLWNQVRVKGGAYGVGCRFNREREGYFTSYRDPNLSATLEVYRHAAEYLEQYDAKEREVTKTIIGTISGIDTPLTPYMKGKRSLSAYLTNVTEEMMQKQRDQVINCDIEDIRQTADVVREVIRDGVICVIGNEKKIAEEEKLFESIEPLQ